MRPNGWQSSCTHALPSLDDGGSLAWAHAACETLRLCRPALQHTQIDADVDESKSVLSYMRRCCLCFVCSCCCDGDRDVVRDRTRKLRVKACAARRLSMRAVEAPTPACAGLSIVLAASASAGMHTLKHPRKMQYGSVSIRRQNQARTQEKEMYARAADSRKEAPPSATLAAQAPVRAPARLA